MHGRECFRNDNSRVGRASFEMDGVQEQKERTEQTSGGENEKFKSPYLQPYLGRT